ncbi:MAG: bifunctional riboflavin kinase/FAD synthetase [Rhodospirillales bacterium]|nr:bifunctional riboflavin kinase/FAD synthetase [Rhodospirillales bacterium]MBO6788571.1 bifunctional riboflavin kinase/FAD synthetase [Rhodospirillales bacterium]
MRIYRQAKSLQSQHHGAVIAVGNFDGVHRGHRTVIGEAGRIADASGLPWGVLTFEPHPRAVFQPDLDPFRLTPFRAKAERIAEMGVDFMIAQRFDMDFSRQSATDFIEDYLVATLKVHHVIAGYDFKFGHKRQGSCETLLAEGQKMGFGFTVVAAASDDGGGLFSSSRTRDLIAAGDMAAAAAVLGRPFSISGRVANGDKRGRTIGFPTANLGLNSYIRPVFGVYAVRATMPDGSSVDGVANLGLRPTFDGTAPRLEVHLFDFDADIYGQRIDVALLEMIRPEKKFDGLDALKAQIARDCDKAREILANR